MTRLLTFLTLCTGLTAVACVGASGPGEGSGDDVELSREERDWLAANREKLTLYYNTRFHPIEYADSSGAFAGLGADIVSMIEQRLDIRFDKRPAPDWNEHLAALESGRCAVAPTIVRTEERERFAYFTKPYATVPVVIITTRAREGRLALEDLEGRKVGVVSGFATEPYVRQRARGRFSVHPVKDVPEGLRDVSLGLSDAFVENLAVAAYHIDREGLPNLKVAGSTDYSFAWSLGVSRHYPLLYSAVQKGLAAISNAKLEEARKRWISLEVPTGMNPETVRFLWLVGLFGAALLLGLAVITVVLKRRLNEKVASLQAAQEQLLDQTRRLSLATEATNAGIWDLYPATGEVYVSEQWYASLGYAPSAFDATISGWLGLVHPDDVDRLARALEAGTEDMFEIEHRVRRASGDWRWVLTKGRAIEWSADATRSPTRIIGFTLDIEQLKRVEEELRSSEELYRGLISTMPDAVVRTSVDGTVLWVNAVNIPLLEEMGERAIIGANMIEMLVPEDRQRAIDKTRRMFFEYQGIQEYGVLRPGGEVAICEVNGDVLRDARGIPYGMVYVVRDVTARRAQERALAESEARFRQLFEMAAIPLMFVAKDGAVIDVNRRFVEVFGYTREELSTVDRWWRLAISDLEERAVAMEAWQRLLDRAVLSGSDIPPREHVVACKDSTVRTVLVEGRMSGKDAILSFFDLTELKRAQEERESLNRRLVQSQKLEAVGRLAGGVAHDFNNMLGVILGQVDICMMSLEQDDPMYEDLETIRTAATRSADLTRQMLAFARRQTVAPEILDLNDTVEKLLKMLRRVIGEGIELGWFPGRDLWLVKIDPAQVDQILVNLCVNARDAIAGGRGRVTIETRNARVEAHTGAQGPEAEAGDFVALTVRDDGCGFDEETRAQIFEPFFTTKGPGQGTGLGLSTVWGIVKQNGGHISVHSEPQKGAAFEVRLPRCHAPTLREMESEKEDLPRGTETVLLVEDEPAVLEITRDMLTRLGYEVLPCGSSAAALESAEKNAARIRLLVADIVMPEMDGRRLAARLAAIIPRARVLFISGYSADVFPGGALFEDGSVFLPKPFTVKELAKKVRAALDRS